MQYKRILLTGMSGTGKSTVVRALRALGYRAIDTDEDGWSQWVDASTGEPVHAPHPDEFGWDNRDWRWNEERMTALLTAERDAPLFVAGTSENQGKLYPHFDHVVLLSAPFSVIMERLDQRTDNTYGTTPRTQARVREHIEEVEPLLRAGAGHEIDTNKPVTDVVGEVLRILDL